jgi:hypothetical protein
MGVFTIYFIGFFLVNQETCILGLLLLFNKIHNDIALPEN